MKIVNRISALIFALGVSVGMARALEPADLVGIRDMAVAMVTEHGVERAAEMLGDPSSGALDLDGSGLHVWAFDDRNQIVFDHSGQTFPGMDLTGLAGLDGTVFVDAVRAAVANGEDHVLWENTVPHPVRNVVMPAHVSCGEAGDDVILCAMAWF